MITLIEGQRQWFKSAQGHFLPETPRSESFCQYTLMEEAFLVVPDAHQDPRFLELPAVLHMGIRFYAGAPVYSDEHRVGTLCVLDTRARDFTAADYQSLQDLAALVDSELRIEGLLEAEREYHKRLDALERKSSTDPITRCWNSETIKALLRSIRGRCAATVSSGLAVLIVEVDKVKEISERLGQAAGDLLLRTVADRMRAALREECSLGRLSGTRFLVIFPELKAESSEARCQGVLTSATLGGVPFQNKMLPVEAYGGLAFASSGSESDDSLLARAEQALGRAKKGVSGSLKRGF